MSISKTAIITVISLALLYPSCKPAWAEEIEVNGLIVNQVQTRLGQEFYRHFSTLWGDPRISFQYNIEVRELADARWGSLITVRVNGHDAYRQGIRPRSGKAEEEARKSIPRVKNYLGYLIKSNGNGDTEDLKGDGL